MRDRDSVYLNEEYKDSISSFLDSNSEFSTETVTELFRQECKNFEDTFTEDTSRSAVRSVAWNQTKHRLRRGDIPESGKKAKR